MYIQRAIRPSIEQVAADEPAHQVADGRIGRRARPASRNRGSATRAAAARQMPRAASLARCEACWCAACARGGTSAPRIGRGQGHAAQSPMAKMSSSRVVCSVWRTTSWLPRLVSSPSMSVEHVGRLDARRPHHELGRNERRRPPAARPRASTSVDLGAHVAPSPRGRPAARPPPRDRRSGSCGRMRGAASIRWSLMSVSGSMRSRP